MCARREIRLGTDWSLVRPLFGWSLLGKPGGLAKLLLGRPAMLRLLIASLTTFVAVAMLVRLRLSFEESRIGTAVTGVLSGLLSTSTGFNGAPVAFYLLGCHASKERFRGTLAVFVLLATVTSAALLVATGIVTPPILRLGLALAPGLLLGFAGGIVLAQRVPQRRFERAVLGFLVLVGLLNCLGAIR